MAEKNANQDTLHQWKQNKFFRFFCAGKEDIENRAKNYNTIPWYKSYRYLGVLLFFISLILGVFANLFFHVEEMPDAYTFIELLAILFPVLYLSIRGWRPFMILLLLYFSADKAFTAWIFYKIGINQILGAFFWWLVIAIILINAIRVQNARARLGLMPQKKPYAKDAVITISGFLILFGLALISFVISHNAI